MSDSPEQKARKKIDNALRAAGWIIQGKHRLNFHAGPGVALCETNVEGGFADYMLFVDGKATVVLEAKAAARHWSAWPRRLNPNVAKISIMARCNIKLCANFQPDLPM